MILSRRRVTETTQDPFAEFHRRNEWEQKLEQKLRRHFKRLKRADYRRDARRYMNAWRTTRAAPLLDKLDEFNVASAMLPVFKELSPDFDVAKGENLANRFEDLIVSFDTSEPWLVHRAINETREPLNGPEADLIMITVADVLGRIYQTLTGRNLSRGRYADKDRLYGFEKFLSQAFKALGISASAERHARLAIRREKRAE